jgi:hypothetical protein
MEDDIFEELVWELSRFRPEEISVVDEGANGIPFLIVKEAGKLDKKLLLELIQKTKLNIDSDALKKIAKELSSGEHEAIKAGVTILKAFSEKIDKSALGSILLKNELIEVEPAGGSISEEDHLAEVKKAKEEGFKEGKESVEKKSDSDNVIANAQKSLEKLDDRSRSLVEALITKNKETSLQVEKINKALEKEREERAIRHFDDEARELKIGVEGLGSVLKAVATNCHEDVYKKLKSVLKVAGDSSLFNASGSSSSDDSGYSGPNEVYNRLEIAAKAKFPDDKKETAVAKFMQTSEGRSIYKEFEKSRRSKR